MGTHELMLDRAERRESAGSGEGGRHWLTKARPSAASFYAALIIVLSAWVLHSFVEALLAACVTPALFSLALGCLVLFCGDKIVRPMIAHNGTNLPFVWVLMGCLGGFECSASSGWLSDRSCSPSRASCGKSACARSPLRTPRTRDPLSMAE